MNFEESLRVIPSGLVDLYEKTIEWNTPATWNRLLACVVDRMEGIVEQRRQLSEVATRTIESQKAFIAVEEKIEKTPKTPLRSKELLDLTFEAGVTFAIMSLDKAEYESLSKLDVEKDGQFEALVCFSETIREQMGRMGVSETILYKCPKCGKESQIQNPVDVRPAGARACPFCLTLLSDKNIVNAKNEPKEVFPAVKPQPQTGIYRTGTGPHDLKPEVGSCFCKACGLDWPNPLPQEPCSHSYCKVCGQELTYRISMGGDTRPIFNPDKDRDMTHEKQGDLYHQIENLLGDNQRLINKISPLTRENKQLKTILQSAYKFKKWSLDLLAKNGICFVAEHSDDNAFSLPHRKGA